MSNCLLKKVLGVVWVVIYALSIGGCEWIQRGSAGRSMPIDNGVRDNATEQPEIHSQVVKPPVARSLKGRPGLVYNPYTGNIVDVSGLASGLLVKDPEDPDKTHTFYVP
jgi:hypothetical protein